MTTHPIDTEVLAKRAGHILFTDGPEQPAATAREVCVLLDLLAATEYRATRAEAQAKTRIKAVERMRDTLHLNYTTMSGPAVAAALTRALDGKV